MRTVLHDWPDETNCAILARLRDALAADSVVVVDEVVIPDIGADSKAVGTDICMMGFAGDRTDQDTVEAFARAGWFEN